MGKPKKIKPKCYIKVKAVKHILCELSVELNQLETRNNPPPLGGGGGGGVCLCQHHREKVFKR